MVSGALSITIIFFLLLDLALASKEAKHGEFEACSASFWLLCLHLNLPVAFFHILKIEIMSIQSFLNFSSVSISSSLSHLFSDIDKGNPPSIMLFIFNKSPLF